MKTRLSTATTNSEEIINEELQHFKKTMGFDLGKISDGYHTFKELYDHRIGLFVALANYMYAAQGNVVKVPLPWKSKLHHDGTMFEGDWFIAGIGTEKGEQISYHLPLHYWEKLRVVTYDKAPEWDGHTSEDVVERILDL